jgi:hypothetical protein
MEQNWGALVTVVLVAAVLAMAFLFPANPQGRKE